MPKHEKNTPSPSTHSTICRCNLCMKSRLSEKTIQTHKEALKSTMVDRRNPDNPGRPLMISSEAISIIKCGETVDMLSATGIARESIPSSYDFELTEPKEATVQAKWHNKMEEKAVSGRDASVFGSLGVFAIIDKGKATSIPKMNALAVPPSFLEKYGAKLIRVDEPVTLEAVEDKSLEELYMVEYDFDPEYIQQYVMHKQGGGGLFVETHPFPHVFTPLSRKCGGAVILGIDNKDDTFNFAAFEIPFGFTLKINSNVIHGDSFFTGPYAIALTETELADSVLLRQDTAEREIQPVKQKQIKVPLTSTSGRISFGKSGQ